MSEIERPLKVFLFHAPADKIAARDIYLRLIKDGVDAWLVKEKLLPRQDWKQEIDSAVHEADVVIVCVSDQFNQKEFRQKEVRRALDSVLEQRKDEISVIFVGLEDCAPLEHLGNRQWVDIRDEAGYDWLMHAMHLRANEIGVMIQMNQDSLPQIMKRNAEHEQPITEAKRAEPMRMEPEIVEGAGILIERTPVKQHKPGKATLLALLGFAAIMMMARFGPSWIENAYPVTPTPAVTATRTPASRTKIDSAITPQPRPMATLSGKGNVSHIVFLIDTSGSMGGQRIRTVTSAASQFVSRLGDTYSVSVIVFNTNVELRLGPTRDHAVAGEVIRSITVDIPHNGACVYDAFYAGIQQASLTPDVENPEGMIILLTDVAVGENVGWDCNMRLMDDFLGLVWNLPLPIFSIYVGDDFDPNSFLTWTAGEGGIRAADDRKEIDRTLDLISQASGLELNSQPVFPVPAADVSPVAMVLVPQGEFIMGDNTVTLDSFWIDKTEVTNAMYARCVQAGGCSAPRSDRSNTRDAYYGDREFDNYPVIYVSWEDANHYCTWVGGRLPTEAEWEKAARGTDGRQFPWGDDDPWGVISLLNFQAQDTLEVGSHPDGASPYGALDMAGNVSEWVADWLDVSYYRSPPPANPVGPDSGQYRVWRGGSWANTTTDAIRTYSRTGNFPTDSSPGLGFRCARDAAP